MDLRGLRIVDRRPDHLELITVLARAQDDQSIDPHFLYLVLPPMLNWLFFDAVFEGASRDECRATMQENGAKGACWACCSSAVASVMMFCPSQVLAKNDTQSLFCCLRNHR